MYQLLGLTVALMALYGAGFLTLALELLPTHPLADLLETTPGCKLHTTGLSVYDSRRLVSGGIMMAGAGLSQRSALWLRRIWSVVAIASVLLAPFNFALALDMALALALLYTLAASRRQIEASVFFAFGKWIGADRHRYGRAASA